MGYIGKEVLSSFTPTVKDSFNGDNSTTAFTLSKAVNLSTDIEVFVDNIQQEPGSSKAYTVSGTTLTFNEAPPTGTGNVYVVHRNSLNGTLLPPQDLGSKNYNITGNLSLDKDSAVLNFGADSDINITHVADVGLTTNNDFSLKSDGAVLKFGSDEEITLTHSADAGLLLKHAASGDDKFPTLTLQAGDTDIAQDDVLGRIAFQAPDEGTGTDAITVPINIEAVSEGDFSASSNRTSLIVNTGMSAAAGTAGDGAKYTFTANGELKVKTMTTSDGEHPTLTFQTGDTNIEQDDLLGFIGFQAPDEATGTDAILIAAGIAAVSEGDFSSSSNATSLQFRTGSSEAASAKMSLTSGGNVNVLTDGASINFGADSEISLTHRHNDGLILKHNGTGDGSRPCLAFHAGEQVIETDDVVGKIEFQAPDETSGTDAIEIVAEIRARAESDFSATSNATSMDFRTAVNAAARTMMTLNSDGTLKLGIDNQQSAQSLRCHNNSGNATIQARNSNGGNMVFQGLNLNGSQSSTISESGVGFFANGVSSDETLKNVKGVMNDGWSKLKDIQPKSFTWKKITTETNEEGKEVEVKSDDDLDGNIHYGVMAQDLKKIIPDLAYGEEGGMSVDYNGLLMIAINTIKELETRITELEAANKLLLESS